MLVRAHKPAFRNNPMEASTFSETTSWKPPLSQKPTPCKERQEQVGSTANGADYVRYTLHVRKTACLQGKADKNGAEWSQTTLMISAKGRRNDGRSRVR